jgi:hypothetical protein
MQIPPEEIQQPDEDNGSLLKKKVKKIKDPTQPKKVLTDGQKKALTAMNDARTKKAEEKLKLKYMKIMEKEQKANPAASSLGLQPVVQPVVIPSVPIHETSSESSSSEEVQVITKPKRIKTKEPKKKKKTKKIIVMEGSSSESDSESEPEIIYQQRPMKSQQNRRSLIQQHNEKQTQKNFFCN